MSKNILLNIKRNYFVALIAITSLTAFSQSTAELESKIKDLQNSDNKVELASAYNKLGHTYWQQSKLDDAVKNFQKSVELNIELNNNNAVRIITGYLGLIFLEKEEYNSAIEAFTTSLNLNTKAGKVPDQISDNYNIASAHQALGNYDLSNSFATVAANKSIEINDLNTAKSCYLLLAENSEKTGDSKAASEYYDKYTTISKHLQTAQMAQLESEKQQIKTEVVRKDRALKSARDTINEVVAHKEQIQLEQELMEAEMREEQARQLARDEMRKTQILYLVGAIVLILIILLLFFFQSRHRKKINKRLQEQNNEIEQQKLEIEKQRDLAHKQKKNLTDSIQYAQRIQAAVLPRQETLHQHFNDSFILHRPRDIVSGDFYWYAQKDNLFVIAAADCTGHGVPGAFMSMLGVAYLNEIVNKIAINQHINALNADEILNQLRDKVISSLHQSANKRDPKDGMDIALCIIDFDHKKVQFSGAYNPLLIVRNGEAIRYKGDKMPVSFHRRMNESFTRQEIDLQENDCLYIFSDGYVDQFGGPKGLKFLMKNFQQLILDNHHKPMQEQKAILAQTFDDWRGEYTQIDDVLVLGFRYEQKRKPQDINWQSKTILIAEDTDMNYFLLAEVLKKTKAKLIRVKNGAEAIELVKSNHIDLVLMDINMPIMDGYEATKQIKEYRDDIPIIIQTAVHEDGKVKAEKAGADDFIAKPIDLKTFIGKLSRILN